MLDELLSEDVFQLEQEVAGEKMITPRWEHCLEYEYQLRHANECLEFGVWLGRQALLCKAKNVDLLFIAPEDFGGDQCGSSKS